MLQFLRRRFEMDSFHGGDAILTRPPLIPSDAAARNGPTRREADYERVLIYSGRQFAYNFHILWSQGPTRLQDGSERVKRWSF